MPAELTIVEAREILGVDDDVGARELTRRYRRLARVRHPDAGGDPDAFQRLQAAYELLRESRPDDGGRSHPVRRGAAGFRRSDAPPVAVGSVDWDGPARWRGRLSRDRLARLAGSGEPVAAVTARSRGPRTLLNWLVPMMSPDLSSSLHLGPAENGVRLGLTVRQGRMRGRLLDASLPAGWTRHRRTGTVIASRTVPATSDPRVNALRGAEALTGLLEVLGWPLSAWRVDRAG